MSVDRVKTSDKGHELGPAKLCELIKEKTLPSDLLCVHAGVSAYFTLPIREKTSPVKNLVLMARLKSNRVVYAPAKDSKKKYGDKMRLNAPATHVKPDKIFELEAVSAKGKPIKVKIKAWDDQLFRGSGKFKGYENPFNLYQVRIFDTETGKAIFKRPMWLAVSGSRRNELSGPIVYASYKQRYDIEHFFRFGKQKLLIGSFQTPDVTHEENWWQIAQLAYTQLYLSRDICQLIPRPWERYLPEFKGNAENSIVSQASPSLTQRSFSKILDEIGTPAHEVRKTKPGKGRKKGDKQEKRTVKPIVFKNKKSKDESKTDKQKRPSADIQGFEKQLERLKPQNVNGLIDILKSWLPKIDISKPDLLKLLAEELPT